MGILDQYKKAIEAERKLENTELPNGCDSMTDEEMVKYEETLNKLRNAEFTEDEIQEAINNSRKNMKMLECEHNGGLNERGMEMQARLTKITDDELDKLSLLKSEPVSEIRVIRAYCPKCGKELVSKNPPMYNPFTMEKVCLHECCGVKYNLDKPYPHIAYIGSDGSEIKSFGL